MNQYGQHQNLGAAPLGFWNPITAASDWYYGTDAAKGTGATTTSAQQAALATQNQQIVSMINAARDNPTPPPTTWLTWVGYGVAVVAVGGVAYVGYNKMRKPRRNPRRRR
jgi:hypothetical protein